MSQFFSLGGVSLVWTPSAISYGSGAHITRHDTLGGGRQFDVMGLNPDDITITGVLAGATRYTDRDKLIALEATQVPLVWGNDSRNVLVLKVGPFAQTYSELSYTITCSEIVTPTVSLTTSLTAFNAAMHANGIAQSLPASVTAPISNAMAILSNASADPSTALPSLAAATSASDAIVANGATSFDPTIAGGTATSYAFTTGQAAWTSNLASVVAARQTSANLTAASFAITNAS